MRAPSGESCWRAFDDLAGRRGVDQRGRPSSPGGQDRRGRHFGGGTDGQDSTASWRDSDVAPIFLPRAAGVANAFGQRWRRSGGLGHPIGSRLRGSLAPSTPSVRGRAGGVVFRWGSRWGSPGEHRAMRFGHEPSVATDFRAEEGLVVASALPKNDRGARTRGDAGTASRKGKALEGRHR